MPRHIIIDGYNLAFALRATKELARNDQQRARELLLDLLRRYKHAARADITVVFDGAAGQGCRALRSGGIAVKFSQPPASADDHIRALVNGARDPGRLLVVSSDREVWRHARNKGAEVIASAAFGDVLFAALERRPEEAEKPESVDLELWQRIFGSAEPDDE